MRALLLLGVVFASAVSAGAQNQVLDYPKLLERLTDVDWLWQPPAPGERCVQFSSYDRKSDKGPGDFDAWYGNDDRGQYLRVEEKDGRKEFVMVDVDGPGVLSRIWSANPSGELFFDVDGERVWTVDFEALTTGKVEPVGEPLAGLRSRGANCHLPIPFGKHLKVSASKGDFYYQCNVVQFAAGTEVPSFRPAMLQQFGKEIAACAGGLVPPVPQERYGGRSPRVVEVPRGHVVREIEITVPRTTGVDVGAVLRNALLRVATPTEELVRVPLLDFFVAGPDGKTYRSTRLEILPLTFGDGSGNGLLLRSRWPMPLPDGGTVALEDAGQAEWRVAFAPLPRTEAPPLLFRASYHQEKGFPSRPFRDFLVLDASGGPGRFVGCSLLVKNPTRGWWGEGDEKFFVDGETFPSTFGTGTEDYFGYAWCDPHPFQSAFHAQTQCDGPGNYGFTAVHRTQVLDAVPFQKTFRFDLEVWHWVANLKLDYATVAYWYGAAGARSGLPPVPPAAERTLDRLPPPPVFVAKDAIEAEGLKVLSIRGGEHEVQQMSFLENAFSRDAQRWWKHGKPGDTLVLALPVAAAGEYRITAAFCKADDYGVVQCSVGGSKLGEPFDGYAERVTPSGPVLLGTVQLPAGELPFTLTITGKHAKAKPAYMVGLDYLRLEKVR
ncbi:MAG: DUF2961 domain-containing protein [Planctomycetes bacterium]|nr:DUF2961 domain-containing protein [Planctomycetota bacterium]